MCEEIVNMGCSISRQILSCIVMMCVAGCIGGCEYNQVQPRSESESLSGVIQLTSGFERAGRAFFSPDMRWIIFQAVPKGQQQFQMYVAKVRWTKAEQPQPDGALVMRESIAGIGRPIRISPPNSR